jgi:hypothetical protein
MTQIQKVMYKLGYIYIRLDYTLMSFTAVIIINFLTCNLRQTAPHCIYTNILIECATIF